MPNKTGRLGEWANGRPDLCRRFAVSPFRRFDASRSAFSFVEIMFAVIILGIGFIMIAALFPVAIQQTQATSNDVAATAFATSISQMLPQIINGSDLVATGQSQAATPALPIYVSFANPQATNAANGTFPAGPNSLLNYNLWTEISGSLINSSDPRYGWVGFYSRDSTGSAVPFTPVPYANVIAIITQCQNAQAVGYTSAVDLNPDRTTNPAMPTPATLQGFPISVRVIDSTDATVINGRATTDLIMIASSAAANGTPANFTYYDAAASGAYVVISQHPWTGFGAAALANHFAGKVLRLGARRADLDPSDQSFQVWELQPGQDYTPEATTSLTYSLTLPKGIVGALPSGVTGAWCNAFIVGRALLDPTAPYTPPPALTSIPASTPGAPHPFQNQKNVFVGNNQAIAAYSFTIPVH